MTAEPRRHDVVIHRFEDLWRPYVVVQQRQDMGPDERIQQRPRHHAAADDDALRGQSADEIDQRERKVARLQHPAGVIVRELLGRLQPPRVHRRTTCEPFETVAMKRAHPGKRIEADVVGNPHVAHLRMHQPVHQPAVHQAAAANTGPDSEIDEVLEPLGCAPSPFRERCRIHVRVEANGDGERIANRSRDIDVRPSGLRRRRDETVGWRIDVQVDRTERGDPDRLDPAMPDRRAAKEVERLTKRDLGRLGREPDLLAHVAGAGADHAHELRSSGFDCPAQWRHRRHGRIL
jgi:hypothetical protein